ncbi:MAG TPA: TraR/DksA C4-type zinc finger protein [Geomonas sp.]|jgi:DnaK suppressor protein
MPAKSGANDKELRELLTERKRKLWAELREELFAETGEALHTQYDIPQDVGEMSILDMLSDAGLAVADIRRSELTNLEEALRRLEMGTYGRCEGCGEPISIQRLRLVPFTAYCVPCQKGQEVPSKPPGVKI